MRRRHPILYVPVPGSPLEAQVERGSAIVAVNDAQPDGRLEVEIEGRRFQESMPANFADRVERCIERWRRGASGLRRRLVPAHELVPVADCSLRTGAITVEYEHEAALLAAWLGRDRIDDADLRTTRSVIGELNRPGSAPDATPTRAPRANAWHTS
jgi:hypothetical protein